MKTSSVEYPQPMEAMDVQNIDLETILENLPKTTVLSFAMPSLKRGLKDIAMRNPEQPIPAMAHWLFSMGCATAEIRHLASCYTPPPRSLGYNPSLADIAEHAEKHRHRKP